MTEDKINYDLTLKPNPHIYIAWSILYRHGTFNTHSNFRHTRPMAVLMQERGKRRGKKRHVTLKQIDYYPWILFHSLFQQSLTQAHHLHEITNMFVIWTLKTNTLSDVLILFYTRIGIGMILLGVLLVVVYESLT